MDRKVAVGMCGNSDARGRTPHLLFLRLATSQKFFSTCIHMLLAARWRCAPAVCEHKEHGTSVGVTSQNVQPPGYLPYPKFTRLGPRGLFSLFFFVLLLLALSLLETTYT